MREGLGDEAWSSKDGHENEDERSDEAAIDIVRTSPHVAGEAALQGGSARIGARESRLRGRMRRCGSQRSGKPNIDPLMLAFSSDDP